MNHSQEDVLSQLVGQPLETVGRASTMAWCGFGTEVEVTSLHGGLRTVREWALHLQCPWIFTRSGVKIIDWESMFVDAETGLECDGASRRGTVFDKWVESLGAQSDLLGSAVIGCSRVGPMTYLDLQNEWRLALEVDPEEVGEQWRLFQTGTEQPHFVVYSSGVVLE